MNHKPTPTNRIVFVLADGGDRCPETSVLSWQSLPSVGDMLGFGEGATARVAERWYHATRDVWELVLERGDFPMSEGEAAAWRDAGFRDVPAPAPVAPPWEEV